MMSMSMRTPARLVGGALVLDGIRRLCRRNASPRERVQGLAQVAGGGLVLGRAAGSVPDLRELRATAYEPVSIALRNFSNWAYDRLTNMDTGASAGYDELEFTSERGTFYMATTWFRVLVVEGILRELGISERDVFIDFGSGKGRMVLVAARFPFRRVIGVELSAKLNEVARENLERNRSRLICPDVALITADAGSYEIPDDVTVAYFANPFGPPLFGEVIDRLRASLERNPRRFALIYGVPRQHDEVIKRGFRVVRQRRNVIWYEYAPTLPASGESARLDGLVAG
jgi:hypothetical protein